MRAGLETVAAVEHEGLLANATARGDQLHAGLTASLSQLSGVVDIRGHGLMVGIELDRSCAEIVTMARDAGLLINVTADRVIRLLPALTLTEAEAEELLRILVPTIRTFLGQSRP
jgi:acetylornithine aminotransferase